MATTYYLIAGNLAQLSGVFQNKKDLLEQAKQDADAIVVTNPNEIYEALSEPQMRRIRADVAARVEQAEDVESRGAQLFRTEDRFANKGKKMAQAQYLYNELRAFSSTPASGELSTVREQEPTPPKEKKMTAPKAPRAPRRNIKSHIRALLANVGDQASYADVAAANPDDPTELYSDASITTAMSDLRSEKYCGEGGPLQIKRIKDEDGSITYVREG